MKIIYYGNPILKKTSDDVSLFDIKLKTFAKKMMKLMKTEDGVGLAAPQVGINKRLIVLEVDGKEYIFVNPIITKKSTEVQSSEGCLSLPGINVTVCRFTKIDLEAQDLDGKKIEMKNIEGILAIVIQHETDHLDGILLTDKISFWEKLKLQKKLKDMEKLN